MNALKVCAKLGDNLYYLYGISTYPSSYAAGLHTAMSDCFLVVIVVSSMCEYEL